MDDVIEPVLLVLAVGEVTHLGARFLANLAHVTVAVLTRLRIDAEQVVLRAHLRADDDHDIDAALICYLQERCEVIVFRGV